MRRILVEVFINFVLLYLCMLISAFISSIPIGAKTYLFSAVFAMLGSILATLVFRKLDV
jgi:hypothetical protein